jgi:hypothetical protein
MITADQLVARRIHQELRGDPVSPGGPHGYPRQRLYPNLRRGAVAVKNSGKTATPPRGRSFRKGASGNPRGRPKGAQNKVTRELQALAQGIIEDPVVQARLLNQAQRGKLAPAVMSLLFHYAYGKPKETLALEKKPVVLVIRIDPPPEGTPRDERPTAWFCCFAGFLHRAQVHDRR